MEIEFDLFYYLVYLGIVEEPEDYQLIYAPQYLPKNIATKFSSGLILSKMLKSIENTAENSVRNTLLDQIQDTFTGIEIIQNWQTLFIVIKESFNIVVDEKMKEMILNRDQYMISELYNIIFEKYAKSNNRFIEVLEHAKESASTNYPERILGENSATMITAIRRSTEKKNRIGSAEHSSMMNVTLKFGNKQLEPINFEYLSKSTPLESIDKVTEFIVVAFAKEIHKEPIEVAALLTEGAKHFSNLIICGKKGEFESVVRFFETIYTNIERLVQMSLTDSSNSTLKILLTFLKSGLVSRNQDVARWTSIILGKIGYLLDVMDCLDIGYGLFIGECGFIKVILEGMKRHPDLGIEMLEIITAFGKENIEDILEIHIRKHLPEGYGFFKFTHEYIDVLITNKLTLEYIETKGVIKKWVNRAIKCLDLHADNSINTTIYATFLLINLWHKFDERLETIVKGAKERIFEKFDYIVKEGQKSPQILHISFINSLITLLSNLRDDKVLQARIKSILLEYISNYSCDKHFETRTFVFEMMTIIVEEDLLSFNDCFRMILKSQEERSNWLMPTNFKFLEIQIKKNNLHTTTFVYLLDFLCKEFMSEITFMATLEPLILQILLNNAGAKEIDIYLVRFIKSLYNFLQVQKLRNLEESRRAIAGKNSKLKPVVAAKIHYIITLLVKLVEYKSSGVALILIKNMTGFLNFQIHQKTQSQGKPRFDKDLGIVVRSYFEEETNISELAFRYNSIFTKMQEEEKDSTILLANLENLFEKRDILGEDSSKDGDSFLLHREIKRVEHEEKQKHESNIKRLKQVNKKLKVIESGATAYERDINYIRNIAQQKIQTEKNQQNLEIRKNQKIRRMKEKAERLVEMKRMIEGSCMFKDYRPAIEELVAPLGELDAIAGNDALDKIYFSLLDADPQEKRTVKFVIEKNMILMEQLFKTFAGKKTINQVGVIQDQVLMDKTEALKVVQMACMEKACPMKLIKQIFMYLNNVYHQSFTDKPINVDQFGDFLVNLSIASNSETEGSDIPVAKTIESLFTTYTQIIRTNSQYFFLKKYARGNCEKFSPDYATEIIMEDGSKQITIVNLTYEPLILDDIQANATSPHLDKMKSYMMCYGIIEDILKSSIKYKFSIITRQNDFMLVLKETHSTTIKPPSKKPSDALDVVTCRPNPSFFHVTIKRVIF